MAVVDSVRNRGNLFSWRLVGIGLLVFVSALSGAYLGFHQSVAPDVILSGVHVAGVHVGGMQVAEARRLLAEKLRPKVERPVYLRWDGGDEFVYPADIGIAADVATMTEQALLAGRTGNIFRQVSDRYRIRRSGYNVPLQVIGSSKLDKFLQTFKKRVDRPPVDAGVALDPGGKVSIVAGKTGLVVDIEQLRQKLLAATTQLDRDLTVPIEVEQPAVTAAMLRSYGLTNVVARFETSYNSGDTNRTHNLRIAAEALDGAIIPAGATFSFNEQVGPRAISNGYKEAPVVINGELVPDIGGGVCQVSSTLFNAVLLAGLRIDFRQSHSIPSTYVPLGQDATVAYNYIDFKFTNTTSQHIYVKAWLEGGKMQVALIGSTPAPAARIVSKVEEVLPYTVEEIKDPTLPAGKRVVDRAGGKGYKVSIWRVTGAKGAEKWQMVGRSTYKPRTEIARVGSGTARAGGANTKQSASAVPNARSVQG